MMKLACLVLAAGEAARFGRPKQLAEIDGKAMVCHVLEQLKPLFDTDLYCVVGAYRDHIVPVIKDKAVVIENPNWRDGMGTSISTGIQHIVGLHKYDGVLIALADQLAIKTKDYQGLVNLFDKRAIVAASYAATLAVPAIFPPHLFNDLQGLEADYGARKILKETTCAITPYALSAAAFDIDTPDNLNNYLFSR